MYYNHRNYLFRSNHLDSYLRGQNERLEAEIESLQPNEFSDEAALTKELVGKYTVHIPVLMEDQKKIDAREGEVTVENFNSRIAAFGEASYTTKGLHITVKIPFSGDGELFHMMASTYSASGTPEGMVHTGELILSYQTAEKDQEKIKALWQNDLSQIKQNLGWIENDLANYNGALENKVKTLLAARKKEADSNQSLIDAIRLG